MCKDKDNRGDQDDAMDKLIDDIRLQERDEKMELLLQKVFKEEGIKMNENLINVIKRLQERVNLMDVVIQSQSKSISGFKMELGAAMSKASQPEPDDKPERTWANNGACLYANGIPFAIIKDSEVSPLEVNITTTEQLANRLEAGKVATVALLLMQKQLRNGEIDTTEIGDYEYIRKGIDKTLKRINKLKGVDANEPNKP